MLKSGGDMEDIYKLVGERVRVQRRQQALTLEDLSELSGLHASYIGQIERGTKKSSLKTVAQLAQALGISPGKLFEAQAARASARLPAMDNLVQANNRAERELREDIVRRLAKGLRGLRS